MQNDSATIPPSAVAALQAGRKIEAIKLVREADGIGLKEAKDAVERYVALHPELQAQIAMQNLEVGKKFWGWVLFVAAIVALLLYFRSRG